MSRTGIEELLSLTKIKLILQIPITYELQLGTNTDSGTSFRESMKLVLFLTLPSSPPTNKGTRKKTP